MLDLHRSTPSTEDASLCLDVARALAEEDKYDIGLIDAHSDPVLLQTQLQIPAPNLPLTTWPISPRLWMVPRQSWLADARRAEGDRSELMATS
jgi:hypothetical protein